LNIESSRQAWIASSENTVQRTGFNPSQLIRRTRLRIALAIIIASLALVASGFGMPLMLAGGFDVLEIIAWSLIVLTLVAMIALVIRAHGIRQTRHLRVLDHVEAAMDELPEAWALVLRLKAVEEMSTQEIADALGIPPGTVMSRVSRARDRITSILAARYGSPKEDPA